MEMACNEKNKWPLFFKFFLCVVGKSLKLVIFSSSSEKFLNIILPGAVTAISC